MSSPLAGQMLLDNAVLKDPAPFYHRLIAEAPVWQVEGTDVYTANSYAAAVEASARVEDFSSTHHYYLYRDHRGLPAREAHERSGRPLLASADPPLHGQHKKVITPAFIPKRIASLETHIAEMARDRFASALNTGEIEFMWQLANMIPIEVVTDLIGFQERNTDALFTSARIFSDMLAATLSREELLSRFKQSDETSDWIRLQLLEAMEAPGGGLLGDLARRVNTGEVEEMVAHIIILSLYAAGGESTSGLLGSAVLMLAQDMDLQHRLRATPTLIPKFVEESLRLESPFRYMMRLVKRDTTLCGVAIPAGASLMILWAAANRDPAIFHRPDELDLDRPRRHVAFGHGIHMCIGNALARLEARVILEILLKITREFRLHPSRCIAWVDSLLTRRLDSLPLILTPA